jgi:hypothetical protein
VGLARAHRDAVGKAAYVLVGASSFPGKRLGVIFRTGQLIEVSVGTAFSKEGAGPVRAQGRNDRLSAYGSTPPVLGGPEP